jgi:predicted alpha/beta-fold hydrolase
MLCLCCSTGVVEISANHQIVVLYLNLDTVDEQMSKEMLNIDNDDGMLLLEQRTTHVDSKQDKQAILRRCRTIVVFFDKYATIVVGGARAMGKYYKQNQGKSLLDKLTVSDIAYSFLVYKSAHNYWREEILIF